MFKLRYLLLFLFVFIFISCIDAAHYIIGRVNNTDSGISPDGLTITSWYNNQSINGSDIIGVLGNSSTENYYMIDCETVGTPCEVGQIWYIKIFKNSSGYLTNTTNITITGEGFDQAQDLLLYNESVSEQCNPAVNQNWVITDSQTCQGKNINLGVGNISVTTGSLMITDGSNITANSFSMTGSGNKIIINKGGRIISS